MRNTTTRASHPAAQYRESAPPHQSSWLSLRRETTYYPGERSEIESEFGEPLTWERLPDRRASRVGTYNGATIA
jgi:hypothetical protein